MLCAAPRPRPVRRVVAVAALTAVATVAALLPVPPASAAADPRRVAVSFVQRATFQQPVAVVSARDGTGRLFVLTRAGLVRVVTGGRHIQRTPYLDLRSRVDDSSGERGLLGLAFSPRFRTDRLLWVAFTAADGSLVVQRFQAAAPGASTVPLASSRTVITVRHSPRLNHNAGQLAFSREGYLLIGTGDSGGSGDPDNVAQSLRSLSGKVLRIGVFRRCNGRYYCIPTGNPLYGRSGVRQEIWASGLRNPWRFSVDRETGNVWVADVGQSQQEEVTALSPTRANLANLGWSCYEGRVVYNAARCGTVTGYVPPRIAYPHATGFRCGGSVIGGYVYRGVRYPGLLGGLYLFGDYCTGRVWAHGGRVTDLVGSLDGVAAFGESDAGELWAVSVVTGGLYELRARRI